MAIGIAVLTLSFTADEKNMPDSKYGGVQVGTITYSFRDIRDVEATLQACVNAGISSVELMGTGIEEYLGAPKSLLEWRQMRNPDNLTREQTEAFAKYQEEIKGWRYAEGTIKKYVKLRKIFNDAGVNIHIYKWTAGESDDELDYSFRVAKALGAVGITTELGEETCKSVGAAAERAGMLAIFHNHFQFAEEGFSVDKYLAMSPANMLNFDAGHYFGSTGLDPRKFIEKYHDRIASIHLKDKTAPDNETEKNENQV